MFNADVLALKADTMSFQNMMEKEAGLECNRKAAKQTHLDLYFGQQVVRLQVPRIYNGNLATKIRSRAY